MPHAVFFTPDGHAIHATNEVKRLGRPASHGCVRLSPKNAPILYDLVEKSGLQNAKVVLSGLTPGGESTAAANVTRKPAQANRRVYRASTRVTQPLIQPKRRGGFFKRMFGAP
jgi:hypothetical protein